MAVDLIRGRGGDSANLELESCAPWVVSFFLRSCLTDRARKDEDATPSRETPAGAASGSMELPTELSVPLTRPRLDRQKGFTMRRAPELHLRRLNLASASGVALCELVVCGTQQSPEQSIASDQFSAPGD